MSGLGPEFMVVLVMMVCAIGVVIWLMAMSPAAKNRRKMKERMKTLMRNRKRLSPSSPRQTHP